jgi:hypothetical protein
MAAGKSVADILAGAKNTLNSATAFSNSAAKDTDKVAPKPNVTSAPPKHEYSNAPYSVAKEANDTSKALKATLEMKAKGQKALQ